MVDRCPDCRRLTSSHPEPCPECASERRKRERFSACPWDIKLVDKARKEGYEAGLRKAAEACTNVIKNYDVMEPGKSDHYASLKIQKAAKGMVGLAREDILALITKDKAND